MANAKKIMFRIPAHVLVSVISSAILMNINKNWACVKSIIDSLVITCDEILDTSKTELIHSNDKTVT